MAEFSVYPIFEPDQVLTHDQLNQLRDYLEQQQRFTRNCLLGIGIVCGFEVSTQGNSLSIGAGVGITSQGFLVRGEASRFVKKRPYVSPVDYGPFRTAAGTDLQLWELLTADIEPAPEITPLTSADLAQSAVLLYLEILPLDSDACTGSDCDEKGVRVEMRVRSLLVARSAAATLLGSGSGFPHDYTLHPLRQAWAALPELYVGRPVGLWGSVEYVDETDLVAAYKRFLTPGFRDQVHATLDKAYAGFRPVLEAEFASNPFAAARPPLPDDGSIQYLWDHYQDLCLAYGEWRESAFELMTACCPDADAFPRHLLLGPVRALASDDEASLRHLFAASPIIGGQAARVRRLRLLFRRLVLMVREFEAPRPEQGEVRITPSREKGTPLGLRALPYYYRPLAELIRYWNPDYAMQSRLVRVDSYHVNDYLGCRRETALAGVVESPTGARGAAQPAGGKEVVVDAQSESRVLEKLLRKLREESAEDAGGAIEMFRKDGGRDTEAAMLEKVLERMRRESRAVESAAAAVNADNTALNYISGERTDGERLRLAHADHAFYRVEGHLGHNVNAVLETLERDIACYQLPIRVIARKLGARAPQGAASHCLLDDLRLVYRVERGAWLCRLDGLSRYLGQLRIERPRGKTTERERPAVKGSIRDLYNKAPVGDAEVRLAGTGYKVNSRADGSFYIDDVPPGDYYMEVVYAGYQSKNIPITVEAGRETDYEAVEIRAEAYAGGGKSRSAGGAGARSKAAATDVATDKAAAERIAADKAAAERAVKVAADAQAAEAKAAAAEKARSAAPGESRIEVLYEEFGRRNVKEQGWNEVERWFYETQPSAGTERYDYLVEQVLQPLQLRAQLADIADVLPEAFDDFDAAAFNVEWDALRSRAARYVARIQAVEADELFPEIVRFELLERLRLVDELACSEAYSDLVAVLARRRQEQDRLLLLGPFARENPGLEHRAGAPRGGTLVLAYDEDGRVAADFTLPYMLHDCCAACDERERVRFLLPADRFCGNDERAYRFTLHPPGGVVSGRGVSRDALTGDYHFTPALAGVVGALRFRYRLDTQLYLLDVEIEALEATLEYRVRDTGDGGAEVQFVAGPLGADAYDWDFGDGGTSSERTPTHRYDTSETGSFMVQLTVRRGVCVATAFAGLQLSTCSARFEYRLVAESGTSLRYRFEALQPAAEHAWSFGDDRSSDQSVVELDFELTETARRVDVELTVVEGDCTDTWIESLELPPARPNLFSLGGTEFCRNDPVAYPFILEPPGGEVTGPGVQPTPDGYEFLPSSESLSAGLHRLTYTLDGQVMELVVNLIEAVAVLNYEVQAVDAASSTALVRFDASASRATRFRWDFGDDAGSTDAVTEHQFDLKQTLTRTVRLEVGEGGCTDAASALLEFHLCDAGFSYKVSPVASVAEVTFSAVERAADAYRWDFGDGNSAAGGAVIRHSYQLAAQPRQVAVRLLINRGVCLAAETVLVNLPAAQSLSLNVTPDVICAKGKPAQVEVSVDGGKFNPPIVRRVAGGYELDPALAGVSSGMLDLSYALSGASVTRSIRFVTPRAAYAIESIQEIRPAVFQVKLVNRSVDANRFLWRFANGQTSTEAEPLMVFSSGIKPGTSMGFTLQAGWEDRCSALVDGAIPFPKSRLLDAGGSGGLLDALGSVRDAVAIAGARDSFAVAFPDSTDVVLSTADTGVRVLEEAATDTARREALTGGSLNAELGESYLAALAELPLKIRRYRGTDMLEKREAAYDMYLALLQQALQVAVMQTRPLAADDPLLQALQAVPAQLLDIRARGLDIDPGGRLTAMVDKAMQAAAADARLRKALNAIRQVLG